MTGFTPSSSTVSAISSLAFATPPNSLTAPIVKTPNIAKTPNNGLPHPVATTSFNALHSLNVMAFAPRVNDLSANSARGPFVQTRLNTIALQAKPGDEAESMDDAKSSESIQGWSGSQPPWQGPSWSPSPADKFNVHLTPHTGAMQPAAFQSTHMLAFDPGGAGRITPPAKQEKGDDASFAFISPEDMQALKERYKSQASVIDTIKEKFLFHEAEGENKALQLFLMDSQGLSLTMATEIADAHGRGYFVLPPNASLNADTVGKFLQFMSEHPDGIVVVPSINNRNPALFPPELLAARGFPVDFSSVYQFAKLANEGISVNPQSPPIVSKNKFLFVIANKNVNNPDKVYGFHNKDVDTTNLNSDVFLAYMGGVSQKYQTEHNSIVILENRGLDKEAYVPLIESFLPESLNETDRQRVIDYVQTYANEKTDYREFMHLAANKVAQILAERYD